MKTLSHEKEIHAVCTKTRKQLKTATYDTLLWSEHDKVETI